VLPSGSRIVIDPSGLTTESLSAASAGVAPPAGGSPTAAASAGTPASEVVVLMPGVALPPLGSGTVNVTSG
jgi:hypothetical protein